MVRALRTIPMFVEIAEAIRDYAPKAWVINYTNPMSLCVKTLYHVFPEIKAFGCCHEVFGTQKLLAQIAERELGLTNIAREDIVVNVLGLNHFTWFDRASYKGIDLFPVYRHFIETHFEEGFEEKDGGVDVLLKDSAPLHADMVVLAIGITPDTALAKEAGLELGIKGSIVVNDRMETSVPDIYAAGDAVQVKHYVTGEDA